MNIFKALFSGDRIFKEEFASSFLGYALSPFKDHKKGFSNLLKILRSFPESDELRTLCEYIENNEWIEVVKFASQLNTGAKNSTLLEFEFIDITIKIGEYILLFENKIYPCSIGENGINRQLEDYCSIIHQKANNLKIIPFAIYPDGVNKISELSFDTITQGHKKLNVYEIAWRGSQTSLAALLAADYPEASDFINNNFTGFREYDNTKEPISLNAFMEQNFSENIELQKLLELLIRKYGTIGSGWCDWDGPILSITNTDKTRIAWPFKIRSSGKIIIQWQGLLSEPFYYRTWRMGDNNINIIDLIKLMLNHGCNSNDKIDFNRFYIQDIANDKSKQKRFLSCLEELQQMINVPQNKESVARKYL